MGTSDRVWLITGCSTGFGRAVAELVLERGERAAVTARRIETVDDFARRHSDNARTFSLDVTNEAQCKEVVAAAAEAFGGIDVLVNNAGYGLVGSIEDAADAQAKRLFDVNLFGVLNVTRAVLPLMRQRGAGRVINVSSAAARAGSPPLLGLYAASKQAVDAVSQTLAREVAPFGIKVTVIEPGAYETNFRHSLDVAAPSPAYAPFGERLRQAATSMKRGDPRNAALAIVAVADAPDPPLRLVLGRQAAAGIRAALGQQAQELARTEALARLADPD